MSGDILSVICLDCTYNRPCDVHWSIILRDYHMNWPLQATICTPYVTKGRLSNSCTLYIIQYSVTNQYIDYIMFNYTTLHNNTSLVGLGWNAPQQYSRRLTKFVPNFRQVEENKLGDISSTALCIPMSKIR